MGSVTSLTTSRPHQSQASCKSPLREKNKTEKKKLGPGFCGYRTPLPAKTENFDTCEGETPQVFFTIMAYPSPEMDPLFLPCKQTWCPWKLSFESWFSARTYGLRPIFGAFVAYFVHGPPKSLTCWLGPKGWPFGVTFNCGPGG